MPVDGSLRGGHVEQDIYPARLGFSFCFLTVPTDADKTLDEDVGGRVIRRRVRRIHGADGRAGVVGLGDEVRRHLRRCPLRSRLRQKEKIVIGLERSSGVSVLPTM